MRKETKSLSGKKLKVNLTILLVAIIIGVMFVEVTLAIFFPFPDYFIKPEPYIVDPVLGYRFRSDADLYQNGELFYTDSNGFRVYDRDDIPTSDDRAIQFIGDSYTFGWMVKTEDAFPYITGEQLRGLGNDIRIVNASTPGWNLWQYQSLYDHLISLYPESIAVVVYITETDFTPPDFHYVEGGNLTSNYKSDAARFIPKSFRVFLSRFHTWRYFTIAYRGLRDRANLNANVNEDESRAEAFAAKWVEEVAPLENILMEAKSDLMPIILVLDDRVIDVEIIMDVIYQSDAQAIISVDDLAGGRMHDRHIDAEKHQALAMELAQLLDGIIHDE